MLRIPKSMIKPMVTTLCVPIGIYVHIASKNRPKQVLSQKAQNQLDKTLKEHEK
jgi:hypothetical protein